MNVDQKTIAKLKRLDGLRICGDDNLELLVVVGSVEIDYGLASLSQSDTALHISPRENSVSYSFKFPFDEQEGEILFNSKGYIVIPRTNDATILDLVLHYSPGTLSNDYKLRAQKATVREVNEIMGVYAFRG